MLKSPRMYWLRWFAFSTWSLLCNGRHLVVVAVLFWFLASCEHTVLREWKLVLMPRCVVLVGNEHSKKRVYLSIEFRVLRMGWTWGLAMAFLIDPVSDPVSVASLLPFVSSVRIPCRHLHLKMIRTIRQESLCLALMLSFDRLWSLLSRPCPEGVNPRVPHSTALRPR